MKRYRSSAHFVLVVIASLMLSSSVAAKEFSASTVHLKDSSISVSVNRHASIDILSDRAFLVYRRSDLGRSDAQPAVMNFEGDVTVTSGATTLLQSSWATFDPSNSTLESVDIQLPATSRSDGPTYSCSGGQLMEDGEGTGSYPTQGSPRTDIIPGAAVYCTGSGGNRIGVTFGPEFEEP